MIKLKEGQKLVGEDGNTYLIETGDCIQNIKEKNTMKKVQDTKKVSEKSGKVEIILTKPYLVEGTVIPAGTKVLVEAEDIYDDFSTPSNIGDASVPNSDDEIYTMRRMQRMKRLKRMDLGEEDLDEEDFTEEELALMQKMNRMKRLKRMDTDVMPMEDPIEEDEDLAYMRRLRRMKRMQRMGVTPDSI
jgi:hypothetical protein